MLDCNPPEKEQKDLNEPINESDSEAKGLTQHDIKDNEELKSGSKDGNSNLLKSSSSGTFNDQSIIQREIDKITH